MISFLLDGILSNYFTFPFLPLFTLSSLIVSASYFSEKSIYLFTFFIGLLYDIVYTNTLFFHAACFTLIMMVIRVIQNKYRLEEFQKIGLVIVGIIFYKFSISTYYALVMHFSFLKVEFLGAMFFSLGINILYVVPYLVYFYVKNKTSKYYF